MKDENHQYLTLLDDHPEWEGGWWLLIRFWDDDRKGRASLGKYQILVEDLVEPCFLDLVLEGIGIRGVSK